MPSYIPLSKGQIAIVDDRFYEQLHVFKWYAVKRRNKLYAMTTKRFKRPDGSWATKATYMHRHVLQLAGIDVGSHTDHANRNPLDNRIENLRVCDAKQNTWNRGQRSGASHNFIGITSVGVKWRSAIQTGGKYRYLGTFPTAEEAAKAYDAAARDVYGEFAYQNFPAEQVA